MGSARRARGIVVAAMFGLSVASATTAVGFPAVAGQPGGVLPDQISIPPAVKQMITVTSKRWDTTTATLRAWRRHDDGSWSLAAGPFPAVLGWNGWVRAGRRLQNTGTTPAGKFRVPYAFGALADPGGGLAYRRFDANDFWPVEPRDPATYNIYQRWKARTTHWRPDYVERLWDYRSPYAYAAVIGFNLPTGVHYSKRRKQWVATTPADTARGGAIFLHVRTGASTAGCVAVDLPVMRRLLRWLEPADAPRIVQGPRAYVRRL